MPKKLLYDTPFSGKTHLIVQQRQQTRPEFFATTNETSSLMFKNSAKTGVSHIHILDITAVIYCLSGRHLITQINFVC